MPSYSSTMHNCNEVDVELESLLVVRDDIVMFPGEEMTVTVSALYNEYFLGSSHFALMYSTPNSEQMLYGTLCEVITVDSKSMSNNNTIVVYARGIRRVKCELSHSNHSSCEFIASQVTLLVDAYGPVSSSPSNASCFGFPSFVRKSLSTMTLLRKAVSMFNAHLHESGVNVIDCNSLNENLSIIYFLCTHLPISNAEKLVLLKSENVMICLHHMMKYLQRVSPKLACRKCKHVVASSETSACLNNYTIKSITVKDKLHQVQQVSHMESNGVSLVSNSCLVSSGNSRYLTDKMVMCSECFNHLGWFCDDDMTPVYYMRATALCSATGDMSGVNADDALYGDSRSVEDCNDEDDDDDRYSERDVDMYSEDEYDTNDVKRLEDLEIAVF